MSSIRRMRSGSILQASKTTRSVRAASVSTAAFWSSPGGCSPPSGTASRHPPASDWRAPPGCAPVFVSGSVEYTRFKSSSHVHNNLRGHYAESISPCNRTGGCALYAFLLRLRATYPARWGNNRERRASLAMALAGVEVHGDSRVAVAVGHPQTLHTKPCPPTPPP